MQEHHCAKEGNSDQYDVTITDWEKAGWYPSYWKFCAESWSIRWDDDWPDHVRYPYLIEYPWMEMLMQELWS